MRPIRAAQRAVSWLVVLALVLGLARTSSADLPALEPVHLGAIETAAAYLAPSRAADRTDSYIREIAGHDALAVMQQTPGWALFPATRRLDIATRAAEAGHPGCGGQEFLARLASALAREFDTLQGHPTIVALRGRCKDTEGPLSFRALAEHTAPLPASSLEAAAIRTLVLYLGLSHINIDVAVHVVVGDPAKAHRILVESTDAEVALYRALKAVPVAERPLRFEDVITWIASGSDSARREVSFQPFLLTAAARYERLIRERQQMHHDPGAADWMRSSARLSAGGVVLGHAVTSAPDTARPVQLLVLGDDVVVVDAAGTRHRLFANPDDACSAVALARQDEAGMVSIRIRAVTLHPVLYNTVTGKMMIAADQASVLIAAADLADSAPASDRDSIRTMNRELHDVPFDRLVWTDRDMVVAYVDGAVRAMPKTGISHIRLEARKDNPGGGDSTCVAGCTRSSDLVGHTDALFHALPPLLKLDRFAETYAIVRWLNAQGATLPATCPARSAQTPDLVAW